MNNLQERATKFMRESQKLLSPLEMQRQISQKIREIQTSILPQKPNAYTTAKIRFDKSKFSFTHLEIESPEGKKNYQNFIHVYTRRRDPKFREAIAELAIHMGLQVPRGAVSLEETRTTPTLEEQFTTYQIVPVDHHRQLDQSKNRLRRN